MALEEESSGRVRNLWQRGVALAKAQPLRAEVLLVALVALAFGLRAYHLGYQSLWRDEIDSINFAQRGFGEIIRTFSERGENGPLYFLLLKLWLPLSGISEYGLRFFSLTSSRGCSACPLSTAWGRPCLVKAQGWPRPSLPPSPHTTSGTLRKPRCTVWQPPSRWLRPTFT